MTQVVCNKPSKAEWQSIMTDSDKIIDGKAFGQGLCDRIADAVATLKLAHGLTPGLAVVQVGEDPASQIYVRNKAKQAITCGIKSFEHRLSANTTQENLLSLIAELNANALVHGILVQLPLPEQIEEQAVINAVDPDKDVDGFHVINTGRLATGAPAMVPCTPLGCLLLLEDRLADLSGMEAVIVGRSNIVGKPMATLLTSANCTVTIAHSHTKNLPDVCRRADILIAAVGRAEMIRGDWVKPGAVVIDVGINRVPATEKGKTHLVGDVAFTEAVGVASAITPVPGGVGPVTIAVLLRNTVDAACRQARITKPEI